MAENLPGKGLWGWLGRQVGYVKGAVKKKVEEAPREQVVHREQRVDEVPVPEKPNVKLRRTTIDEVVVDQEPRQMKQAEEPADQDKKQEPDQSP